MTICKSAIRAELQFRYPLGAIHRLSRHGTAMSVATFWAAFGGFALGSLQSLVLDGIRARLSHRRHLRLWRSELRRLAGYTQTFLWTTDEAPASDTVPNPPRITASYQRLLQDTDFWLTDAHDDDNTQQGLIEIADGAAVLERYSADTLSLVDQMNGASPGERMKFGTRAIATSQAFDRELSRWQTMVDSALGDVERRLEQSRWTRQAWRAVRPSTKGTNPPSLLPVNKQ